ncbi:glycosyltransferase [Candidatus Sumerlaeota bacterium]|nr:glycosyltransferase [Candidatus Sumerlaeota bacterium]
MPRVLHIYKDFYPPIVGGIEKHLNLLCRGISDEYQVRVLVANRENQLSIEHYGAVEIVKAPCRRRLASAPVAPMFPQLIRDWPADIVHFHMPNPTGELAWMVSRAKGRVVATYHSDIVRQKWMGKLYAPFQYLFMAGTDMILPTSPHYLESSKWLRRFKHKCNVIPLGIDLKPFADSPERMQRAGAIRLRHGGPLILFVGCLRYYKGLDYLIEAMSGVDATCLLIGEGPEREKLERQIATLGLRRKVLLLGGLPDQAVADHLQAADVFCLPSHLRSEAYGLSQIEAMASGTPVVSCRLDTGVPFVNVDGVTGFTCEPANALALRDCLNRLLQNDDLRREMGEQARARAMSQFSAENMIMRVKKVYENVLSRI